MNYELNGKRERNRKSPIIPNVMAISIRPIEQMVRILYALQVTLQFAIRNIDFHFFISSTECLAGARALFCSFPFMIIEMVVLESI